MSTEGLGDLLRLDGAPERPEPRLGARCECDGGCERGHDRGRCRNRRALDDRTGICEPCTVAADLL